MEHLFFRWQNILLIGINLICVNIVNAAPITPQFRSGTLTTSSSSEQIINETITSHSFKTGYTYSAAGHNIETDTYVNPAAVTTNEQTVNGVKFNWTSPTMESIPRWQIKEAGAPFSLVESVVTPGLDTITSITRQITTSTTTESISVFGQ
tara:strand:+ start:856 stop:1308 length:453 start_codon:yes stop_codon:yes gene_type:complete